MNTEIRTADLSPLRYPGSKRRLVPYLYDIVKHNRLEPNVLVEPFVGGGSVLLHFLHNNIVKRAIIGDGDRLIYSFWHVVFSDPAYLIDFIRRVKVDLRNFYAYKAVARAPHAASPEKLAEACIFLNRTSFSGILTNEVGPLGGREQKSEYKISCRFNRQTIITRIKHISQFAPRVIVLPYSWRDTLDWSERWLAKRKRLNKPLFYFDPPFFNKGDELYREYFTPEEHKLFHQSILTLKHNWILSYDNAPEIRDMYSRDGSAPMHVEMPYSINAGGRRLENELIITPLSLPPPPRASEK